ncbi:hypothetical protein [Jannaschia sp. W003]|uniref:hypothetical protein n=1 Tax=Jannaschia sp. W003 TaxID=2867012 RepID=UPI0021A50FEC|nr:hypothetical protein [Jannaschia sp. W003]UWQ21820.1 hypothetical protein K3554_01970 [Jannaschia sp. W003]
MVLEDFAVAPGRARGQSAEGTDLFDRGYQQGWEDAAAAIRADDLRAAARLATRLEGMTHTQSAAMSLCLAQIEPLLAEIFDKMLPRAADRAFLGLVIQEAASQLRDASGHALTLRVAPEAVGPLHAYLEGTSADLAALRVEGEAGLAPLEARLVHPGGEREIDLAGLLDGMDDAFDALRTSERSRTDD